MGNTVTVEQVEESFPNVFKDNFEDDTFLYANYNEVFRLMRPNERQEITPVELSIFCDDVVENMEVELSVTTQEAQDLLTSITGHLYGMEMGAPYFNQKDFRKWWSHALHTEKVYYDRIVKKDKVLQSTMSVHAQNDEDIRARFVSDMERGFYQFRSVMLRYLSRQKWETLSPSSSLSAMKEKLNEYGVAYSTWGTGNANSLHDLKNELEAGRAKLRSRVDGDSPYDIVREVTSAVVHIYRAEWQDSDYAKNMVLVHTYDVHRDGGATKNFCLPSGPMFREELPSQAVHRLVSEIQPAISRPDPNEIEFLGIEFDDTFTMDEYPGLRTTHVMHSFKVSLAGLPVGPFVTSAIDRGSHTSVHRFFEYMHGSRALYLSTRAEEVAWNAEVKPRLSTEILADEAETVGDVGGEGVDVPVTPTIEDGEIDPYAPVPLEDWAGSSLDSLVNEKDKAMIEEMCLHLSDVHVRDLKGTPDSEGHLVQIIGTDVLSGGPNAPVVIKTGSKDSIEAEYNKYKAMEGLFPMVMVYPPVISGELLRAVLPFQVHASRWVTTSNADVSICSARSSFDYEVRQGVLSMSDSLDFPALSPHVITIDAGLIFSDVFFVLMERARRKSLRFEKVDLLGEEFMPIDLSKVLSEVREVVDPPTPPEDMDEGEKEATPVDSGAPTREGEEEVEEPPPQTPPPPPVVESSLVSSLNDECDGRLATAVGEFLDGLEGLRTGKIDPTVRRCPVMLCHGRMDLNSIIVDSQRKVWLCHFDKSAVTHSLWDLARLHMSILIQVGCIGLDEGTDVPRLIRSVLSPSSSPTPGSTTFTEEPGEVVLGDDPYADLEDSSQKAGSAPAEGVDSEVPPEGEPTAEFEIPFQLQYIMRVLAELRSYAPVYFGLADYLDSDAMSMPMWSNELQLQWAFCTLAAAIEFSEILAPPAPSTDEQEGDGEGIQPDTSAEKDDAPPKESGLDAMQRKCVAEIIMEAMGTILELLRATPQQVVKKSTGQNLLHKDYLNAFSNPSGPSYPGGSESARMRRSSMDDRSGYLALETPHQVSVFNEYTMNLIEKYAHARDPVTSDLIDIVEHCAPLRTVTAAVVDELLEAKAEIVDMDTLLGQHPNLFAGSVDGVDLILNRETAQPSGRTPRKAKESISPNMVIFGLPGAGKSVVMRRLCLLTAIGQKCGSTLRVPIHVPCDQLAGSIAECKKRGMTVNNPVMAYLLIAYGSGPFYDMFMHAFSSPLYSVLLLLDGFDEMPNLLQKELATFMAEEFHTHNKHCYEKKPGVGLGAKPIKTLACGLSNCGNSCVVSMRPVKLTKLHRMIPGWTWTFIAPMGRNLQRKMVTARLSEMSTAFMAEFEQHPIAQRIGTSPLLLNLIATMFYYMEPKRLPSKPTHFYDTCIHLLLNWLHVHKRSVLEGYTHMIGDTINEQALWSYLEMLAWDTHCVEEGRDISVDHANQVFHGWKGNLYKNKKSTQARRQTIIFSSNPLSLASSTVREKLNQTASLFDIPSRAAEHTDNFWRDFEGLINRGTIPLIATVEKTEGNGQASLFRFVHKDLQEFMAARHLVHMLNRCTIETEDDLDRATRDMGIILGAGGKSFRLIGDIKFVPFMEKAMILLPARTMLHYIRVLTHLRGSKEMNGRIGMGILIEVRGAEAFRLYLNDLMETAALAKGSGDVEEDIEGQEGTNAEDDARDPNTVDNDDVDPYADLEQQDSKNPDGEDQPAECADETNSAEGADGDGEIIDYSCDVALNLDSWSVLIDRDDAAAQRLVSIICDEATPHCFMSLTARSCPLGPNMCQVIRAAIEAEHKPIPYINLRDNYLSESPDNMVARMAIVDNIYDKSYDDDGAMLDDAEAPQQDVEPCSRVLTCLHSAANMDRLDFMGNPIITSATRIDLARALHFSKSLTELNIEGCSLGDSGVKALENELALHGSIMKLSLCNNEITPRSAPVLSRIFRKNNVLREADLSFNSFSGSIKVVLGGLVEGDSKVEVLKLVRCNLGPSDADPIVDTIGRTGALKVLVLQGNNFGKHNRRILNATKAVDIEFETVVLEPSLRPGPM